MPKNGAESLIRESLFDRKARIIRSVRTFMSSEVYSQQLIQEDEQRKRELDIAMGRLVGKYVLYKIQNGISMEEYDLHGNLTGNTWERFRGVDPNITYADMGFTPEQIDTFETKQNFANA